MTDLDLASPLSGPASPPPPHQELDFEPVVRLRHAITQEVRKVVVGQEDAIDGMIVALLARGHVLLEGVPGTAKTLMVRTLAASGGVAFGCIPVTPHPKPSDILGTHIFDLQTGAFRMTKGPIFAQLLLADEINRAPAKTQSALLEAMQERQVSIDGQRHDLGHKGCTGRGSLR